MKVKQAVVMVGGMGTRLLPLTESRPKIILPVADRPCLWYLLRSLALGGVKEVILACGYKSELMRTAIGDGSDLGLSIEYSYEDEPRGTGGAMKLVEDRLDDTFVSANGDVFVSMDVSGEIRTHLETKAAVTIALTPVDNPCEFGIVRTAEDGEILEFKEKPRPEEVFSNLINAGVYVLQRDVLDSVPEDTFFDFSKDLVPSLMAQGRRIQGHRIDGVWMDVGRPRDLLRANLAVADFEPRSVGGAAGCSASGSFYIGPEASVTGTELVDSVVLNGADVQATRLERTLVMGGCRIYGADISNSILGEGCMICNGARISNAVLHDGCIVAPSETVEGDREVRSDLLGALDGVPALHAALPGPHVLLGLAPGLHLQGHGVDQPRRAEPDHPDGLDVGLGEDRPVPGGDLVGVLLLHGHLADVDPGPLLEEVLLGLRAPVEDGGPGGVDDLVPGLLQVHADDVLVRLHVRPEPDAGVPERDQLPGLRVDFGDAVVHGPHQVDRVADLRVDVVDR